ncbi:MAG: phosphocholine cytidylyltransferase family protein [Candidatus Heimdallarchaeaceae archaeon]
MKAIILASGIGKRLLPLTKDKPKSLINVGKKTIIEMQLDNLKENGIKDIIITTGPFEDKMQLFLREKYPDLNISYVPNPQYDTTNYIYSLWLTKDLINDDIILIHGDLVFDKELLKRIIENREKNLVAVNKKADVPKKDFKAEIENEIVVNIGVNNFSKNSFLSMPLYKFSKKDFLAWIDEIDLELRNGNLQYYAEDAFNKISDKIILKPLYFEKELCMEIDTKEDLDNAKKLIQTEK